MDVKLFYRPFVTGQQQQQQRPQHKHKRLKRLVSSVTDAAVKILEVLWTAETQSTNTSSRPRRQAQARVMADGQKAQSYNKDKYLVAADMFTDYITQEYQAESGYSQTQPRQWDAKHWDLDKFKDDFIKP